jgi:hypothetical protein
MLQPPLPLPESSVTSQPKNAGNVIEARSVDDTDGLASPYAVPENADSGETTHTQHEPAPGAHPVRERVRSPKLTLGSHVRNRKGK